MITQQELRLYFPVMSDELEKKFLLFFNSRNWTDEDLKEFEGILSDFSDESFSRGQDSML